MNAFGFVKKSHIANWVGLSALCLLLASCGEETASSDANPIRTSHSSPSTQNTDDQKAFEDGGGSVSISGTTVRIRLPADTSQLLSGPPLPLADGTACLSCHDAGEVAEFTADPQGPSYEVTNEFCRECHSADYMSSQPPLNAVAWEKVVKKMVDKFDPAAGGSVRDPALPEPYLNPEHQKLMVDYLVATYGQ